MLDLARVRQEYMRDGLDEADALSAPLAQFARWFEDAQTAELTMANAMSLATVSADGKPSSRVVLLKGLDDGGFVFYTNYASRKGRDIAGNAHASLLPLVVRESKDAAGNDAIRLVAMPTAPI